MDLTCDERFSDSPYIERIWYSRSDHAGAFTSIASARCELVVTKYQGQIMMTVRGPETQPTPAYGMDDAEFMGIQFKAGAFIRLLPALMVRDRQDVNLPLASNRSFWLHGSAWEFPTYDNADTFVKRLVRADLLVQEPLVRAVLQGQPIDMSLRTAQRRFLQATGLTYGLYCQIERARGATRLLKEGVSILDAVHQAGYADQPHLTRSLRRFIGMTPTQLVSANHEPLSFLFKTLSAEQDMIQMFG